MSTRVTEPRRAKVSATVDAMLLREVDAYVAEHPEVSRGEVFDEALRLWSARERERAMEEMYSQPLSAEEAAEYDSWRRIRRAAAIDRLFRPQ